MKASRRSFFALFGAAAALAIASKVKAAPAATLELKVSELSHQLAARGMIMEAVFPSPHQHSFSNCDHSHAYSIDNPDHSHSSMHTHSYSGSGGFAINTNTRAMIHDGAGKWVDLSSPEGIAIVRSLSA